MSVYLDPLVNWGGSASFRWKDSCHMWADSVEELHQFASEIGMKRAWFQEPKGSVKLPHYDLNASRRRKAVAHGALELDRRDSVRSWVRLGYMRKPEWMEKEEEQQNGTL